MAKEEAAKPSEVRKMPGKTAYDNVLRAIRTAKKDASEAAGIGANARKAFIEKWGYNRIALGILGRLSNLENEKLRDVLDCLDHGRDVGGLNERAASVQPMQFESAEGEEESAGAEQGHRRGRNVRDFPKPGSVAAE